MPMGNTCGDDDDLPPLLLLLPEELWIQILVWLPVISLLRFKSVCKSWHALIKSSFFIDLHTTATTTFNSSPKFGSFILQAFEYCKFETSLLPRSGTEKGMFMLSSSGSGGGEDVVDDRLVFKVDDLGFPPCSKDSLWIHSVLVVGSCNGLICLHDSDLDDVSLCNPATRQFRLLPKSISIEEEMFDMLLSKFIAFGFDDKTKDYKVVLISCFTPKDAPRGEGCICQAQVYSLFTDSWRLLEGIINLPAIPYSRAFVNNGIYLNGSYFFVGEKFLNPSSYPSMIPISNRSLMFSFDFTKEIFTTMQFPDHDSRHRLVLRYFGEKIAVFTILIPDYLRDRNSDSYDFFDMWVLNEHGSCMNNKESWTKVHSFRIESKFLQSEPMCILNNGEFVLIRNKDHLFPKLQLFNLLTKEVEKDFTISFGVHTKKVEKDITIGNGVLRADFYQQSLVSITGGSGAAATSDRVVNGAMCKWLVVHLEKN